MTDKITTILAAVALFLGGYHAHDYLHECPTKAPEITAQHEERTQTEIAYLPKAQGEQTDLEIKINKPELKVKVNDKDFVVQKADNEAYVFDQNKLTLTQTSSTDLNIAVPTVDKTKRYEIGVGISKNGAVGLVGFPVGRYEHLGGWVAGNEDCFMGGVSIKF